MSDADEPPDASKLTRTKQNWAQQRKFLTGRHARPDSERLPPGQHLVKDWPVLDLGRQPDVEKEDWKLKIFGAVDNPFTWDWASFTGPTIIDVLSAFGWVTKLGTASII